ncbi:MAG TPA: PepSY-associated TM helix domain-containing protein [Kofleriaceae bacterium]|nr:PepSY-associated TM helix domain-containing protein [Kofleriaceae bacterium]
MANGGPAAPAPRPLWRRAGVHLRKRWRAWLRAIHRDVGYLLVGLTFVYALSGLAINHIGEWDPNFKMVVETHQLERPLPEDEVAAGEQVLAELGIEEEPRDAYWETDGTYQIYFDARTIVVDPKTLIARDAAEKPRFFLRVANWLHYNRGKEAWTYVADGYALLLLYLATSGLFMLKGRKGLIGRGAVLVALGVAVPVLYVHFSGGP